MELLYKLLKICFLNTNDLVNVILSLNVGVFFQVGNKNLVVHQILFFDLNFKTLVQIKELIKVLDLLSFEVIDAIIF